MNLEQLISLIYLASGLILLVLAAIILRENPGNRLNRMVTVMLTCAAIAPLATAIYESVLADIPNLPTWFVNSFYIWELFFPALLYFSVIFPEPQSAYVGHKRLFELAFIPHFFHLILVIFLADPERALNLFDFESQTPILSQVLLMLSTVLKVIIAFFIAIAIATCFRILEKYITF